MIDADTITALESIAGSLKRLADHFAPLEEARERRPATLSNAIYIREEKDREEIRKAFRDTKQKSEV